MNKFRFLRHAVPIAVLTGGVMLGAALSAGSVLAMGAPTPPPPPVQVERAPPARPAHTAPAQVTVTTPQAGPQLEYLLATEIAPSQLLYRKRTVVVFADTPADPAFTVQMVALETQAGPLVDRDVVVISDSEPGDRSAWRQWLAPVGFSLVIVDKDGQVKQRKPQPWDVREIVRAIDKFPSRLEELRQPPTAP